MKTDKKVNKPIAIVLIVIGIITFFAIMAEGQTQIGYRIVIDTGNKTPIVREVRSKENLKKVVDLYYPKSDININEFMGCSIFFEVRRNQYSFHVQTMRVNKNGKFRKLNRKQIKQIESLK